MSDLCVEQKMMATVSAGLNPEPDLVENVNVSSMKLTWMEKMVRATSSRLVGSNSMFGLLKVSQKVV